MLFFILFKIFFLNSFPKYNKQTVMLINLVFSKHNITDQKNDQLLIDTS